VHWLGPIADALFFARDPGFVCMINLGTAPLSLPPHREVILASGPMPDTVLPPDTGAWVAVD
jgi:alpha-glucosidase